MATSRRLAATFAATTLALFGGAACSSDSDESAKRDTAATPDADQKGSEDAAAADASHEDGSGGDADATTKGSIVVELGGQTWELDQVVCGFGEKETGVEGAELNVVAASVSASLYIAVEPDNTYIEFGEPESVDGGVSYTTLGGSSDPDIQIDGRSISATAEFYDQSDFGADPVEGSVTGTCP